MHQDPRCCDAPPIRRPSVGHHISQVRFELEYSGQLPGMLPYGMANPSWNESQLCGPCQEAFLINRTPLLQKFGSSPHSGPSWWTPQYPPHSKFSSLQAWNRCQGCFSWRLAYKATPPPEEEPLLALSLFFFLRSSLSELPAMKENVSCGHETGRH